MITKSKGIDRMQSSLLHRARIISHDFKYLSQIRGHRFLMSIKNDHYCDPLPSPSANMSNRSIA